MNKTLFEKVWDAHVVERADDGDRLYVDMHYLHEVTSPPAFAALARTGTRVRRPDLTMATVDHVVPTRISDKTGSQTDALLAAMPADTERERVCDLLASCREAAVRAHAPGEAGNGITHVIGPELGLTQPGMLVACGDSHTTTHGALGALALGVGTSEVARILATQTMHESRPGSMRVRLEGEPSADVSAKDLALAIARALGSDGALGCVVEYQGAAVRAMSVEGRMTLCNMAVEAGARAGIIAPDERTLAYLRERPYVATGADWARAVEGWASLVTDEDARFDRDVGVDVSQLRPQVTWGTRPCQAIGLDERVPDPASCVRAEEREAATRALTYMGLHPGQSMQDVAVDLVFIGSCTNGRIEDLRQAAGVVLGRRVARGVRAVVVPGSMAVKAEAERTGLDRIFRDAGFEWRLPGCSYCIAMNGDRLEPGRRSASTSNRNFEGRQGPGARAHLVSPAVAAATAVAGVFAAPADL